MTRPLLKRPLLLLCLLLPIYTILVSLAMIATIWLVVPSVLTYEKIIHYGWVGGLLGAWIGLGQWFLYWLIYRKK